jgi:hypothetical protein
MYYRLLSTDVHEAARIVNCPKKIVESFIDTNQNELKEAIFNEFNTLSVIYGLPQSRFVKAPKYNWEQEQQEQLQTTEQESEQQTNTNENEQQDISHPVVQSKSSPPEVDLLGFGDSISMAAPSQTQAQSLTLQISPIIDKQTYASKWSSLPVQTSIQLQLQEIPVLNTRIESLFSKAQIITFASGTVAGVIKCYLFARDTTDGLYLIECIVDMGTGKLNATMKLDSPNTNNLQQKISEFSQIFQQALAVIA